jgi:hypothetical protein
MLEVRKKRTDQEIASAKALQDGNIEREKAKRDSDLVVEQEYYKAVLEVAKGSIDRARASAETVQKASAAIVTLYTGVLALAFSVADNPLPAKALFAAIMLGVAICLSTGFLAYVPDPDPKEERGAETGVRERAPVGERLTSMFVRWTRRAALQRGRWLRGSVVALAGAVALMPAPFVTIGGKERDGTDVAWPKVSSKAGSDPELQKIVYTAQVAEAADQRKAPLAEDELKWPWWALAGTTAFATLAVIVFPWPKRRGPVEGPPEPAAVALSRSG